VVLDVFLKPEYTITNYQTRYSGLEEVHINSGISFGKFKKLFYEVIRNKIIIGHSLINDFKSL